MFNFFRILHYLCLSLSLYSSLFRAGTIPDIGIVIFTLFTSALTVVPVYGVVSLAADHNEKMTKRRMTKLKKHGTHGGHGTHDGGHGDGHGAHGATSHHDGHSVAVAHGTEHSGHGEAAKPAVDGSGGAVAGKGAAAKEKTSATKVVPEVSNLASWGRE